VGDLAKGLFPGGVEIPFDADDFDGMIAQTREWIDRGVEVIYEATFKERGIFAMVDILVRNGERWDLYEVKASAHLKNHYHDDAAIQWYALSEALELGRAYLVHINNRYERNGPLRLRRLFRIEDITDEVLSRQETIPHRLQEIESMLHGDEPSIAIGPHCFEPHACDFRSYCWRDVPAENSVFELSYANGKQWQLFAKGIDTIDNIPDDYPLGANASLQVAHHKTGEIKIDKAKIRKFLERIEYPINFFDFETFQEAIPRFDKERPYEQVPFQYSLHILYEDGHLEHREFLADENEDPREPLIRRMLEDLTPTGSIVAYNQSFEITQIKNLARHFPRYETELLSLIDRFVDLAYPFQKKLYYHPGFKGGYSIKVVLPTLFPHDEELDYAKLGSVQNGGDAMETFAKLHLLRDKTLREAIRKDLLAYCRLDTLAMVRIWQKLQMSVDSHEATKWR